MLTAKERIAGSAALRDAELELCRRDRSYHIQNHFWIKDKEGVVRLMTPLKRGQKKLAALLDYCRRIEKIPARILVYKNRKVGISSYTLADMLCEITERGYDAIEIAHDKPTAQYLFGIVKRYYKQYDLPKPELQQSNKRELSFKEHEGFIEVLTSGSAESSRARTPQYIHSSEGAFWQEGAKTAVALFQSLPNKVGTTHVFETTPNGEDALFKPLWDNAYDYADLSLTENNDGFFTPSLNVRNPEKWNGWIPLYLGAIEDEDCRLPITEEQQSDLMQTLDNDELYLRDKLGAPAEFLKWRRHKLAHECRGDVKILRQEYSCTPREGFVVSGRPRFDIDKLDKMASEPGTVGYLKQNDSWDRQIVFIRDRNELLTVFRKPIPGHNYILAIDSAEGLMPEHAKDPDASVMIIVDLDEGGLAGQVATYSGQVSEEYLLGPARLLAEWYNNAYVVPEVGGGHGLHLVEGLKKAYPVSRIYHRLDSGGDQLSGNILGWKTHEGNRKLLVDGIANAIADEALILRDANTIRECKAFKWSRSGQVLAAPGHHDDHVICLGLCVVGMKTYPYSERKNEPKSVLPWQQRQKEQIYQPRASVGTGRNSITGY